MQVKSAQSYCKNSIVDDCSDYEVNIKQIIQWE